MLKEFREFIAKGNVLDLAIGVIIGAAFTAIVNSFVKDILTPVIGLIGTANFDDRFLVMKQGKSSAAYATIAEASKDGAVTMNYGTFLTAFINFLIVAFVLFLIVKAANRMRGPKEEPAPAAPPEPTKEEVLLTEIRDLLKSK